MSAADAKESQTGSHARLILQQCMSAKLQTQPKTRDQEAEFVQVWRRLKTTGEKYDIGIGSIGSMSTLTLVNY